MSQQTKQSAVGRQVKLSTSKAMEIAWKNIRLRLSRSLVVTSGIVLAMAFLMYIFCNDSTTEAMRRWSQVAPAMPEFVALQKQLSDIQNQVQDKTQQLIQAATGLDKKAEGKFDARAILGKDLVQIQKDMGSLPVAPAIMGKLLATRPDLVPTMKQWMQTTAQAREIKAQLNGPQLLLSLMRSNGVPTTPKEIENNAIQTRWMIGLALLVAFVGILNAMLMSVTERFREIGTMKCLGALDSFIVKLLLIESLFQGGAGTLLGAVLGLLLNILWISGQYGSYAWKMFPYASVLAAGGICLLVGVVLTVGGAVYPAYRAARMHPIEAMRVEA